MLGKKVEMIQREEAEEKAEKEWGRGRWGERQKRTTIRTGRSGVSPVVKVLTSATFIRSVMGILKKMM